MDDVLERRKVDARQVRDRMDRAPTPRERVCWHAIWLAARGWSAVRVAEALDRDAHTIGERLSQFRESGHHLLVVGLVVGQRGHGRAADAGGELRAVKNRQLQQAACE